MQSCREVNGQVDKLASSYDKFKKLYPVVDTSTHMECNQLKKWIIKELKIVQKLLAGLKGAVDQVNVP